jgi:integrative and conjugative element protein (TIGR02256 family)
MMLDGQESEKPKRPAVADFVFWSDDQCFGLRLSSAHFEFMCQLCSASFPNETGGVLIGHYSTARDCACVSSIIPPPKDSVNTPTTFVRGTRGLKALLNKLYRSEGNYYIGEWHFHPNAVPQVSGVDHNQMCRISRSVAANCVEPILLIIGGGPDMPWDPAAYVYPRDKARIDLHRVVEE